MTRAASFQGRLNPNGYSMLTGPGSDDSLHSSTSSLENSGGGGGAITLTKLGSYTSPLPQGEYYCAQPQFLQQHLEESATFGKKTHLKKVSSHGSVFHSEMDQGSRMILGVAGSQGVNRGSMPSLDLQICDGGGMVSMQRGRGGGRTSPGLRFDNANANWNDHLHNASSFVEEGHCITKHNCQQRSHIPMAPLSKAKETPRLNKFPLDLDSLVSSTSPRSPIQAQRGSISPNPPRPPLRSTGNLQHHTSSPSTPASPSASLSSLDSSSDTPPLSLHHPFLPFPPCSPTLSQGSIPVPEMSFSQVPRSTAQSPKLEILPGPRIVQGVPSLLGPYSPSAPRAIQSLEDSAGDTTDTVGSILQRIASFSQHVISDTSPTVLTQPPAVQSNGVLSPTFGIPTETTPRGKQGMKKEEGKMIFVILL